MALSVNSALQLAAVTRLGLTLRLTVHPSQIVEATGSGYAGIPLTRWKVEGRRAVHEEVTFTFAGALGTVYGYYVTSDDGTVIIRDEIRTPEGEPPVIRVAGDEVRIAPILRMP